MSCHYCYHSWVMCNCDYPDGSYGLFRRNNALPEQRKKESKMTTKKYDWSKLPKFWRYYNTIEDPRGHFIGDGTWRYYIDSGELGCVVKGPITKLSDVKSRYESAYDVVKACEIAWQDSAKAAIEGASVSLKFDSVQAVVSCHSSSHGIVMLYSDFTARLSSAPTNPDGVVALGTVIINLRASGWTVK